MKHPWVKVLQICSNEGQVPFETFVSCQELLIRVAHTHLIAM